jgi:hypothetical protein
LAALVNYTCKLFIAFLPGPPTWQKQLEREFCRKSGAERIEVSRNKNVAERPT